jgi:hypothetical protein
MEKLGIYLVTLALTLPSTYQRELHFAAEPADFGTFRALGLEIPSANLFADTELREAPPPHFVSADASSKRLPEVPLCKIETTDIVEPPNGVDVDKLLYRYLIACREKLNRDLDSIYAAEKRDQEWAAPIEEKVRQTAAMQAVTISGDCHTSLCRFSVELPSAQGHSAQLSFDHSLVSSLGKSGHAVSTVYFSTPKANIVEYVCSNVAPVAFIGSLRMKMENISPLIPE